MKILVVEDEALALEGLLGAVRKTVPEATVNGFLRAEDALHFARDHACDVAFLDIEMAGLDGVGLAERLKEYGPDVNIIFCTGYPNYREAAFDLHASGYLMKPITPAKVKRELENLRRPVPAAKRVQISCFGNFEVYLDGVPAAFKYRKTKELLAYLVDRKGALCTNGELAAILFEDGGAHKVYLRTLKKDLLDTLQTVAGGHVLVRQRGKLGLLPDAVDCDYYDWCAGKRTGPGYRGEYMAQYSWSEYTNAALQKAK